MYATSEKVAIIRVQNIEDINEDIKVGGGEPPKKNDNDYCQIMYPA